jgi:DNA repair ATPase RecN
MSSNPQQKGKKKIGLNTVISWGASVVIIGLMFKILHWPGGELFISLGLMTEALLFFILGVAAMSATEEEKGADGNNAKGLEELLATSITPKVIEKLTMGFQSFNKTVDAMHQVANAGGVSEKFVKEIEVATGDVKKFSGNMNAMMGSFDQFNKSIQAVSQMTSHAQNIMKDFETAGAGLKTFAKNVTDMNSNFDQLNKTLQILNQVGASTQNIMKEFDGVASGIKSYNKNITELSKIYQAQVEAFRKN